MLSSQLSLELIVNKFDLYHVLIRFSGSYFYKNTNAVNLNFEYIEVTAFF